MEKDGHDNKGKGALWKKVSKGGREYWSGSFDGKRICMFTNIYKESEKHPDFKLIISEDSDGFESIDFGTTSPKSLQENPGVGLPPIGLTNFKINELKQELRNENENAIENEEELNLI